MLTITERLRKHGVVGKFVEFYGPGLEHLSIADRATLSNMCPEYGATIAVFPIDRTTLDYLRLTGRDERRIALVEAYAKAQGLFWTSDAAEADYAERIEVDLGSIEPCLAGPRRPQDRVTLSQAAASFDAALAKTMADREKAGKPTPAGPVGAQPVVEGLDHGAVVIAAITSCTNTSNPSVMIGAGLLAKKAVERGLRVKPWVKTSLAPGSKAVTQYLDQAGLTEYLDRLGFQSGGLRVHDVHRQQRAAAGGRGRRREGARPRGGVRAERQPQFRGAHPVAGARQLPGVAAARRGVRARRYDAHRSDVAAARQGRIGRRRLPEGHLAEREGDRGGDARGRDRGVLPSAYSDVFSGEARWQALQVPTGDRFVWDEESTYIRHPPFFEGLSSSPAPPADIRGARVLALLGDSVTTDHISPAGSIQPDSPAGKYLVARGVPPSAFNSYGARRGNHEVMVRGTFANIRLRNLVAPGHRGRLDAPPARRRDDDDLRRLGALPRGGDAAAGHRRQGVRVGLVA